MTGEPDQGTSLERRAESLPELSAPQRAGAVVSEFVASIVQEAQSRAAEIVEAAEAEAAERRQAAQDAGLRAREQLVFLANEVPVLLSELQEEVARLTGSEPGATAAYETVQPVLVEGSEPAAPAEAEPPLGDSADSSGPRGSEELVADDHEGVTIVDAEIATDEMEAEAAEAQAGRLARMTDEELARAYANAARAAAGEDDPERAAPLRGLVQGAVQEALRRPAFTDAPPAPSRRRPGLLRRRRRRTAVSLAELREACRTARGDYPALERSAG